MGNRLYVGNLPFDATEKQIRSFVEGEGRTVTAIKIVTDRDTGRSRGFAFVDLENADQAQKAIADLNGKDFGGRALVDVLARPEGVQEGARSALTGEAAALVEREAAVDAGASAPLREGQEGEVAFSADGRLLASPASGNLIADGAVNVWDAAPRSGQWPPPAPP